MTNEKSKFKGEYTLDVAKLSEERNRADNKEPFPHQSASFEALTKTLPIPVKGYKGTMLVLPTGGGKTFTAVNWICRNVIAKGGKVLWLAQKADLLDQAANAFKGEIHNATGREVINLRVVSSSSVHANSGSISLTDDILICTTQTAISAYSSGPLDENGNPIKMPLRKFIDNCKDEQLFVVVDEAHHTPAPGCRNLLIAMRESVANLYVLGLTATPTHTDESISGWLKIIYDKGICYEADEENLRVTGILAQPTYIQKNTDIELEVDDRLYNRLEREHKDLPDDILYALADNQSRNNFIVSEYVQNKAQYRKTLIFADRWFQCEYIVTKLKEQGVRADAVYSVVSGQKEGAYISGHGRTNDDNRQVMEDFRANKLDVLVNVRMLSEGTDIPDVKTVMITRQTTSKILQKQMIGRALRGKKAGGGADKDSANIVFFHDKWKRLLSFADIKDGRAEVGKPVQKSRLPMEFISVQLVRLAAADIPYKGFENVPFITYLPVGFWGCEYIIAIEDTEEIVSYQKFVCVYEFNQEKYIELIDFLLTEDLVLFESEKISDAALRDKATELAKTYFDWDEDEDDWKKDNFDDALVSNIIKIIRHIAQTNKRPLWFDFNGRESWDLDKLAEEMRGMVLEDIDIDLTNKFNDKGLHWNLLYRNNYSIFFDAFQKSQKRLLAKHRGHIAPPEIKSNAPTGIELTDEIKNQVRKRDNSTCLCCGANGKGVQLEIDHIIPVAQGGTNEVSNLQTLCSRCNQSKGVNAVDYRSNKSPLRQPKEEINLFKFTGRDYIDRAIYRCVNEFYHCHAVYDIYCSQRRNGKFYKTWEIVLYQGNNPDWLQAHESKLLEYVHAYLGHPHVEKIIVRKMG